MQYGQCDGLLDGGERCQRSARHRPPCRSIRAQRQAARERQREAFARFLDLDAAAQQALADR